MTPAAANRPRAFSVPDRFSFTVVLIVLLASAWFPPEIYAASAFGCSALILIAVLRRRVELLPAGWLAAGIAWLGLALGFTQNLHRSLGVVVLFFSLGCMAWLSASCFPHYQKPLLRAVAWVVLGLGIFGFYQFVWGFDQALETLSKTELPFRESLQARFQDARLTSRFTLPAELGGYMTMVLPLLGLGWRLEYRQKTPSSWWLGVMGAAMAAAMASFIMTLSIGAALALGLGGILALLFFAPLRWRKRAGLAAAVVLVLIAGFGSMRVARGTDAESFNRPISQRLGNWRIAGQQFADYPWLGTGLGNYGELYPRYTLGTDNATQYAHNAYLQLLAETGLAGLPLWFAALGLFLRRGLRQANTHGEAGWLMAGSLIFLLHNGWDITLYRGGVAYTAFFIFGAAFSSFKTNSPDGGRSGTQEKKMPWSQWTWGGLCVLVLMVSLLQYGSRMSYERAEFLYALGNSRGALANCVRATRFEPMHDTAWAYKSQLHLQSGRLDDAREAAEQAIRWAPERPFYRSLLGRVHAARGDFEEALIHFEAAVERYPQSFEYKEQAAQMRRIVKRKSMNAAS